MLLNNIETDKGLAVRKLPLSHILSFVVEK